MIESVVGQDAEAAVLASRRDSARVDDDDAEASASEGLNDHVRKAQRYIAEVEY